MLDLDITIHARTPGDAYGTPLDLDGCEVRPLARPADSIAAPFAVGFEQAAERLAELDPMIHFEPDGWFIWHSPKDESPVWQINGNLYDRQERLWLIPLRGKCPESVLMRLLTVLANEPAAELMFELTRAGIYVDLPDLLHYATQ